MDLTEADTRKLIDQQLLAAGWEADTAEIRYSKGVRPEKGKNKAIAEWPTQRGPADYVLFNGLTAIAVVEAKRKNIDVYGTIDQAERCNKGFQPDWSCELIGGSWGKFNPKETKIRNEWFIQNNDFLISRANTIELVGISVIIDKLERAIKLLFYVPYYSLKIQESLTIWGINRVFGTTKSGRRGPIIEVAILLRLFPQPQI